MLLYKSGLNGKLLRGDVKKYSDFDFSAHTTYGLGGKAVFAYFPKTILQAEYAYDRIISDGEKIAVIGCGSNMLVADDGFNGEVISMREMKGIINLGDGRLLCLAGTTVGQVLKYCKDRAFTGLEYLYGIPATLGGAAYMNAGVGQDVISNNIEKVHFYCGKKVIFNNKDCKFSYRYSTMRDINGLITAIIVNVKKSTREFIEEKIEYYKNRRKHLPRGRSCGCVFKNPNGFSAGYLIEASGLKGARIGGAVVSDMHANFIINEGGSAADVRTLIRKVKADVHEKFGVMLEEEVVYIGEFNETDS